jgi:hypothetical protein
MSVVQVKQQQIVVRINLQRKQMMMKKKKMNQFILNQVQVLDGKNDVKQFVYIDLKSKIQHLGFFFRLLNVIFRVLMHLI